MSATHTHMGGPLPYGPSLSHQVMGLPPPIGAPLPYAAHYSHTHAHAYATGHAAGIAESMGSPHIAGIPPTYPM